MRLGSASLPCQHPRLDMSASRGRFLRGGGHGLERICRPVGESGNLPSERITASVDGEELKLVKFVLLICNVKFFG